MASVSVELLVDYLPNRAGDRCGLSEAIAKRLVASGAARLLASNPVPADVAAPEPLPSEPKKYPDKRKRRYRRKG